MPDPKGFPTHKQFLDSVANAKLVDFSARPTFSIDSPGDFQSMRNHILDTLSSGIEVAHSFVDENGQIYDCVPIDQQISLRQKGAKIVPPVDLRVPPSKGLDKAALVRSQLSSDNLDRFGNRKCCPEGTIPVRRVTLEEMTRFGNMREFFRKTPVGHGRHPRLSPPEEGAEVHKYSHAYQQIPNLGGHGFINIWDPAVGSQIFSLAQHWYTGGNPLQSAECGWQVFPQKYQTTKPALFVYWTADGYSQTGAYNLDAPGFVQTNSNWALGAALANSSTDGGSQFELEVAWQLIDGNWWLYVNGTNANDAIGYYPTSLYNGGQMATAATDIDFGGEVLNQTFWPPMGSGAFAASGYQHAAYFRDIYYFDSNGAAQEPNLNPEQPSANCYTINGGSAADPWNASFFFGGPGGNGCQ